MKPSVSSENNRLSPSPSVGSIFWTTLHPVTTASALAPVRYGSKVTLKEFLTPHEFAKEPINCITLIWFPAVGNSVQRMLVFADKWLFSPTIGDSVSSILIFADEWLFFSNRDFRTLKVSLHWSFSPTVGNSVHPQLAFADEWLIVFCIPNVDIRWWIVIFLEQLGFPYIIFPNNWGFCTHNVVFADEWLFFLNNSDFHISFSPTIGDSVHTMWYSLTNSYFPPQSPIPYTQS